jgi:dTDP-4-amino-4,6-dideoxygalactose transaminase
MDALEIALRVLGIGSGHEVITTPMTAFASVLAIIRAGATPVLADIDASTGLLSLESVQRSLSSKTRAIMLVHLYGQMRNLARWRSLCNAARIELIEDCAQSHLASESGRIAGAWSPAAGYSFYPTKNLGALGDAGILVTNDDAHAEQARMLRNYGQSQRYHHPLAGLNSRLDEIHAAMLEARLAWLPQFTERRRAVAAAYYAGLKNPAVRLLASPTETSAHVWHLFVVTCERRDKLAQHLREAGIQTLIHYPVPIHRQPPCVDLRRDPLGLSFSEEHARTCLSLPCHPQLSDQDVARVIDAVNAFEV